MVDVAAGFFGLPGGLCSFSGANWTTRYGRAGFAPLELDNFAVKSLLTLIMNELVESGVGRACIMGLCLD